ncbi:MAG: flagellar basal body-associated FliL family protein [Lautropia sp.]|nr:flagellar basal body-associated FliL family protein [Lautropia sp.]
MSGKPTEPTEEGKKKGGKGLLIGILAVVLAGGGGAGWYFLKPPHDPEAEKLALYKPDPEPVFVTLDPFTVNLADEGGERMAQVSIVLQMQNKHAEEALKKMLPVVRSDVLKLLSSQKSDQLLGEKGKDKLADSIKTRATEIIHWDMPGAAVAAEATKTPGPSALASRGAPLIVIPGPVVAVHFNQLLVQ